MYRIKLAAAAVLLTALAMIGLRVATRPATPSRAPVGFAAMITTISDINAAVTCNTSVLINFNTSAPTHAYLEYGLTTSYGSTTIDDSVRYYQEHAIQITGLSANTTYHYRVRADDGSLQTNSSDRTFTTLSSGANCPAMPSEVDSRMPNMTGAVEKTVKTSGGDYTPAQFQTALNDAGTANEKRIITVDAGLTLTGVWTMPANADGNWIVIRSSQYANLPEGRRVMLNAAGVFDSTQATKMFRIQNTTVEAPVGFAAASNHIRLIGAEITIDPTALANAPGGNEQSGLVQMQANVAGSSANLAKFITFDRCYVHGLFNKNTRRGIYASGEDLAIIDSYLEDFHSINGDAQAILFADVKRARILNCTLIGSGENFMWGGTGLGVPGYVIGSLEFLRNHQYYPIIWKQNGPSWNGFVWREKNLFELKTSAQVLVFGNYFGGTSTSQGGYWPDAQSMAINLKLEQNSVGPTTCELMEDVIFYKNYGRNLAAGTQIIGRTTGAQGCTNIPTRVWFTHNEFEMNATFWTPDPDASSGTYNATGWALSGTTNLQVVHNTTVNATPAQGNCIPSVFTDGMMLLVGDPPVDKVAGFVFKDNITDNRGCGVVGGGFNGNNATGSLDGVYTGWSFTKNGIVRTGGAQPGLPAGNFVATTWTTQVVNFNNGLGGDYRVASGSSWDNAATDGSDLGADITAVERAVAFTPTGLWAAGVDPTPTPTPTSTPTPTPTPTVTPTPTPVPSPGVCKPNQPVSSGCTCPVPPRRIFKGRCKP